jgi:tetratricopeptide (TPR) repeat protein
LEYAVLLLNLHRYDDAESLARAAFNDLRRDRPAGDPEIADSASALGRILLAKGSLADAEPLLRDAVAVRRERFGPRAFPTTRTAGALIDLLERTNRPAEAAAVRKEFGLAEPATAPATLPATPPTTSSAN